MHALSLIAGSDTDAQKALHTCLLVSKAFYYPCCRETFSSVHLRFYPTHKSAENCRVDSLLHLVNANPYLANTVNTLVLELCTHRRAPPSASGSDEELCSLIDTLGSRSLNTLEINGKGVYDGWMSSGGRLLPTLLHLRGRPSLRKLILRTIGDVPRALVTGDPDKDNLEHLLIENVRFTTSFPKLPVRGLPFAASPPIEPSGISPIVHATAHSLSLPLSSLKHLDVTDPEKFAAFLMRHERHSPYANLSFPNLQSLSVNGSSMYLSIDRLKRLIHACSSIERLSLRGNFELPGALERSCCWRPSDIFLQIPFLKWSISLLFQHFAIYTSILQPTSRSGSSSDIISSPLYLKSSPPHQTHASFKHSPLISAGGSSRITKNHNYPTQQQNGQFWINYLSAIVSPSSGKLRYRSSHNTHGHQHTSMGLSTRPFCSITCTFACRAFSLS